MRFGKTLREAIYPEWRERYIDYSKLKALLREDLDDDDEPWTEKDETRFSEEIFNVQLEKVAQFQEEQMVKLTTDIDDAFHRLRDLAPADGQPVSEETSQKLRELEAELDGLTNRVKRLKQYSTINYTGFLKIVKKHDRKRGDRFKVRPLMNVQLSARPFNSEQGYSPLLNKLSIMYFAIRQQLEAELAEHAEPLALSEPGETHDGERYMAHKFWIHRENLLEVKTYILRRLPALVYHSHSSETDAKEDPAVTSLYFDNPKFELYTDKVNRQTNVTSVRLRWYGQLAVASDIFVEKKSIDENGTSHEQRFTLKDKYVKSYLDGGYKMEKTLQKMKQKSKAEDIEAYEAKVGEIQSFIQDKKLSPVLRANYVRSAFQKPGDNRVRISIDTDIGFVREDTLDQQRPCRDPRDWHRSDIEKNDMTYPFMNMNQAEVSRFPHALLEIKVKADANRKPPAWVEDLMGSHLVHKATRFSKFVHGVASLFDDYVNNFPFWLSELDTEIRKDPRKAFDDEEQRRAQRAEDESAIGSFLGGKSSSLVPARSSPMGKSLLADRMEAEEAQKRGAGTATKGARPKSGRKSHKEDEEDDGDGEDGHGTGSGVGLSRGYGTISSYLPNLSMTRYGRNKRLKQQQKLPEGVEEPVEWIKNSGELRVEPKVWLANERTYIKWEHIAILIGSLALALYAAAGKDQVALGMGLAYIAIAAATAAWGGWVTRVRQQLIRERSGKDFDFDMGPIVISVALMVALILNFYFQWEAACGACGGPAAHGDAVPHLDKTDYTASSIRNELV